MRVFFRTDSSAAIGSGHVMRCLALAIELKSLGADVTFICRNLPGNMAEYIRNRMDFHVILLPAEVCGDSGQVGPAHKDWLGTDWQTDAFQTVATIAGISGANVPEWIVVDHYALDIRWEKTLRPSAHRVLVIDDLADRSHDCDFLLDQNLYPSLETRYENLVPAPCRKLLGPRFALLRREFPEARRHLPTRDGSVRRAMVFFGGVDASNETEKAIEAWQSLGKTDLSMDVIVGGTNPFRESIREQCGRHPQLTYHEQVSNMATLMTKTDLAIGAGGTTTWERCCLSLPTLCITVAENQKAAASTAAEMGLHRYLGHYTEIRSDDVARAVRECLEDPARLATMARNAGEAVDGMGAPKLAGWMME
jgi:UDP-2,4-diacetamido-2,4,6-trideoxy-beta-L-altropyranose hydrolase